MGDQCQTTPFAMPQRVLVKPGGEREQEIASVVKPEIGRSRAQCHNNEAEFRVS